MKMPKRGEKGFTLIELLIVVAILGVLAAIVIPNVGKFIGEGEDEARDTEFANIQSAVHSMMVDCGIQTITDYATTGTSDMTEFPSSTDTTQVLYANNATGTAVNYVATNTTTYLYTVDASGTVTQGAKVE